MMSYNDLWDIPYIISFYISVDLTFYAVNQHSDIHANSIPSVFRCFIP